MVGVLHDVGNALRVTQVPRVQTEIKSLYMCVCIVCVAYGQHFNNSEILCC